MALWQAGKCKALISRLEPLFQYSFFRSKSRAQSTSATGQVDFSKWRKLDSREFGLARSQISFSSRMVLNKLQMAGFDAYLVGGCVRDFLLNKVPKDFDVITTASLKQVKRKFQSAIIIGRRFPICRVTVNGSVVEVSSFDTEPKHSSRKQIHISKFPIGCNQKDVALWNNSLQRDFTINSLYYDPYSNKIFDYTGAMADLTSLTLRTVIPAHMSFKDDQARILRGLRLAARLDLSFSREAEDAIFNLSSSVADLSKSRIHLEMNYMLSYGAAEMSLLLLRRFNLLEILLPFSDAYLLKQAQNVLGLRSSMLMKLFFNLDQLITCDRPCDECLWVALLAFHLALYNNPQNVVVALTLASLFSHGTWDESVNLARQHAPVARMYVPEIVAGFDFVSDDEVAERIADFSVQVKESVDVFTSTDCLMKSMAKFPKFSSSGLVWVPQKLGQRAKDVFHILLKDVRSLKAYKNGTDIDYRLLKEGDIREIRFVLGKIIMDTLVGDAIDERSDVGENIIPSTDPLQKVEVLEETRDKNTQSMVESNHKVLRDKDSKVRLYRKNVFTADKPSGRLKTYQSQENTISGKYKDKTTIQKTVNTDEYYQSSQKHSNVLPKSLSEVMRTVHTHKEKDQPLTKYHSANEHVSCHNSPLGKIDEDKQVKGKVRRATGTLLSSLFT